MATNRDVFNEVIRERNLETLKKVSEQRIKLEILKETEKELPTLVRSYVKEQTKNIKTLSQKEISDLVESLVSNLPIPEKVIERTEVKVVPAKQNKVEIPDIEPLKKEIEKLKKLLKEREKEIDVQYIGTMIPNYNGQNGKVLSVVNGQLAWVTASSSGGSLTGYSVSNGTIRRTFDARDTSLDELADVIYTMISDLGGL